MQKSSKDEAYVIGMLIAVAILVTLIVRTAMLISTPRPIENLDVTLSDDSDTRESPDEKEDPSLPHRFKTNVIEPDKVKIGDMIVLWKVNFMKTEGNYTNIKFGGESIITGQLKYLKNASGKEVFCMNNFSDVSKMIVPNLKEDPSEMEFCFSNGPKAKELFVPSDAERKVTVIIRDYEYVKKAEKNSNTATLVKVVNK